MLIILWREQLTNAGWRDLTSLIPGNGTITSIESDTGGLNNGVNWAAVEIDGVILKDSTTQNLAFGTNGFYLPLDGNSPIGEDQQASPINDGTVWSNFLTSSGSFATSPTLGFDGIISSCNECRGGSGDTLTFTPPAGINYIIKGRSL